jgi:2-polyprenyl-3-methyl-5-hydroxy-6-metoxy-1,4-benzoquinol methylase
MPLLSDYARKRKCRYFIDRIPKSARVLEVGCGGGWLKAYLRAGRWTNYVGLDLHPPADIVGDIRDWRKLGLHPESFDVIVAFEVVEHGDIFDAMYELLMPGGLLMLTSPVPSRDWICRWLEAAGLAQKRTSPHTHLVRFEDIPRFERVEVRRVGFLAQWGIFRKPGGGVQA